MKEALTKLLEQGEVLLIILGALLFLLAASGDVTVAGINIPVASSGWRYFLGAIGAALIVIGLYLRVAGNGGDDGRRRTSGSRDAALGPDDGAGDVSFLDAYLSYIKPTVRLTDTYQAIVSDRLDELSGELQRIKEAKNWVAIIAVKERLREYFEYSGEYRKGVVFGRMYIKALRGMDRPLEAAWAAIKDVGYLLILDRDYEGGRRQIEDALKWLEAQKKPTDSANECCFYAYRYLGISYQRDTVLRDLAKAQECFRKAQEYADRFPPTGRKHDELWARILGNWGNVALDRQEYCEAEKSYRECLRIFREIGDREHVGIANLYLSRTLIAAGSSMDQVPTSLEEAHLLFIEIGWLEGEARVQEQFARYYARKAQDAGGPPSAYVREALSAAGKSREIFSKLRLERDVGHLDDLIGSIEDAT